MNIIRINSHNAGSLGLQNCHEYRGEPEAQLFRIIFCGGLFAS